LYSFTLACPDRAGPRRPTAGAGEPPGVRPRSHLEGSRAIDRPDDGQIPEDRRKAIFLALVEAQDRQLSVPLSREATARQFGLSVEQVRQIEREGLDAAWPPL
jgi:hypothetical protein